LIDTISLSYSSILPLWENSDSIEMVRRSTLLNQGIGNLCNTHNDVPTQNMDDVLTWWHYMLSTNELLKDSCRTDLETIAEQCPDDGGIAVYMARSLLESWTPFHVDDRELCEIQQQLVLSNFERIENDHLPRFQLVPNPAAGRVLLTITGEKMTRLRLISVTGFVGYDRLMGEQSHVEIELSGLAPGIYITEVETTSKQRIYAKLVIQ